MFSLVKIWKSYMYEKSRMYARVLKKNSADFLSLVSAKKEGNFLGIRRGLRRQFSRWHASC